MADQTLADMMERRKSSLKLERATFIPHYQELGEFVTPRRGRYFMSDHNKGDRRFNKIVNSRATRALRIFRAGLIAGVMSPSQQSFKYEIQDPDLNAYQPVKMWLHGIAMINQAIFNESNLYTMLPPMIGELGLFGVGCMSHLDDFNDVARFYTHTVGSYMLGQNEKFQIDTLIREFEQQVSQIVAQHGLKNCSPSVKTAYDRGNYDQWFPVTHFVAPSSLYDPTKKGSARKAFMSVYYEPGVVQQEQYLSQKGFDEFPAYAPRWDVTGEDIYATDSPGMTALGDIKGLQIEEKRKAQAIDKMVSPPLTGPASLKNVPVSSLPGGMTVYDSDGKDTLRAIYQVNPQLQELRLDMKAAEERIDDAFYVNLFNAISDMEGVQPRNQLELKQRDQERLLQLGDPLQRLYIEFLNKMHDRVLRRGFATGIYPPPPPIQQLSGHQIMPHYIGPLALAQRTMQAQSLERLATFTAGMAQLNPQAGAKIDTNKAITKYADIVGADPDVLVSDDVLAAQADAQAKAQAAAQVNEAAGNAADTIEKASRGVKHLSEAPTPGNPAGPSALMGILNTIQARSQQNAFQAPPQR